MSTTEAPLRLKGEAAAEKGAAAVDRGGVHTCDGVKSVSMPRLKPTSASIKS